MRNSELPLAHQRSDNTSVCIGAFTWHHRRVPASSAASSAATASGSASGATKYVAEADHGAEAKATAPTTTTALSFQSLEQDMPMIEDVLNLLPHLLF